MSAEERLVVKITADTREAVESFNKVKQEAEKLQVSIKNVATSFSGVVTAGMALYGNYERIRNAQITLSAAAKEVHESEITIAEYRGRLADATQKYGASSQEVAMILQRIRVNEELLAVKEERLRVAHENVTKAYIYTAATVIPNLITGLESSMKLYESLKGIKSAVTIATYVEAAAEGTKAGAVSAATLVQWLYNKALTVTHALSGPLGWAVLGVAAAVTAATAVWLNAQRQQEEYNRSITQTISQTKELIGLEYELSRMSPLERLQREYAVVRRYYETVVEREREIRSGGAVSVSIGTVQVSANDLGSSFDRDRTAEDLVKRLGYKLALKGVNGR